MFGYPKLTMRGMLDHPKLTLRGMLGYYLKLKMQGILDHPKLTLRGMLGHRAGWCWSVKRSKVSCSAVSMPWIMAAELGREGER